MHIWVALVLGIAVEKWDIYMILKCHAALVVQQQTSITGYYYIPIYYIDVGILYLPINIDFASPTLFFSYDSMENQR